MAVLSELHARGLSFPSSSGGAKTMKRGMLARVLLVPLCCCCEPMFAYQHPWTLVIANENR